MKEKSKVQNKYYDLCVISSAEEPLNNFKEDKPEKILENVIPLTTYFNFEDFGNWLQDTKPDTFFNFLYLYNQKSDETIGSIKGIIEYKENRGLKIMFLIFFY